MELFIGKFNINIHKKRAQWYSFPMATYKFCSHEEKLPGQVGLPSVVQWVTVQAKVSPGVSELPRGNELCRDYVNRPKVSVDYGVFKKNVNKLDIAYLGEETR